MQDKALPVTEEHRKLNGRRQSSDTLRKANGTHMPVCRNYTRTLLILPVLLEDREFTTKVEFRIDAMDRRRRNNAGPDVADINGLLSHQNGKNKDEPDEALPKYGSADEYYDLKEEIGKGAYGIVRKCIDKGTNTVCAAKIVKTSNSKLRKETMREIELMVKLGCHKKLVGLLDAYHTPFEIVMILELVSGGELFERIVEEDYLMEEDAIDYVRQLLEGLKYMHSKNIVHLDLKPENILCVSKDSMNIKLVDFGLAQQLKEGEDVKSSYGTPDFVAPEVIRMKPVSRASDMWSLGVVTYVILSGLMPFAGDSDKDTLVKVAKGDWDFDDDCFDESSEDAKDFIEDLLQKEPSERLTIEECFMHPWIQNTKKVGNRIDTVKHKSFLAKRRWKKSINALVAVRRMSSLLPSFANRRPSMDSAILAAKKANNIDSSEERNGSVPLLTSVGISDTAKEINADYNTDIRRPRSQTIGPTYLSADANNYGSVDSKKDDEKCEEIKFEVPQKEFNNNDSKTTRSYPQDEIIGCQGQLPRPHEQVVLKIHQNGLQSTFNVNTNRENESSARNTTGLDLAISRAHVEAQADFCNTPQKITIQLSSNSNNNKTSSNERIPSIVLNDDPGLLCSASLACPSSPRKFSTDNYFISEDSNVDSATYVMDTWSASDASQAKSKRLSSPESSKVCIRTVDQKGQTITVKLDGLSSVELPANKSTCSHIRRASTGSEGIAFLQSMQPKLA